MMSARTNMPILKSANSSIPCIRWSVIAGHERQAMYNHGQTLERLAERGGLSPCEAVAIIEDRKWHRMDAQAAEDRLLALCASQSAAPVAASGAAEMTAQGVFEVLHSEFQGASNRQLLAATAHILAASGSAQPASEGAQQFAHPEGDAIEARTERIRLSHANSDSKGKIQLRHEVECLLAHIALLRSTQAATVTGASHSPEAIERLLKAVKVYANNWMQDEADPYAALDLVCTPDQHTQAVEVFAAIKAMAPGAKP